MTEWLIERFGQNSLKTAVCLESRMTQMTRISQMNCRGNDANVCLKTYPCHLLHLCEPRFKIKSVSGVPTPDTPANLSRHRREPKAWSGQAVAGFDNFCPKRSMCVQTQKTFGACQVCQIDKL
jgi:hypothetical protein